jgi:hypothetical protein
VKVNFRTFEKLSLDGIDRMYRCPSASRPGLWHFVIVYNDGRGVQCTCEGFMYNGNCWHSKEVPDGS